MAQGPRWPRPTVPVVPQQAEVAETWEGRRALQPAESHRWVSRELAPRAGAIVQ